LLAPIVFEVSIKRAKKGRRIELNQRTGFAAP